MNFRANGLESAALPAKMKYKGDYFLIRWYFEKRWPQKNISDDDEVAQRRNEGVAATSLGNQMVLAQERKSL